MRNNLELWKIVQKYYPYYGEPSLKDNIKYLSRSTVMSDEEEQYLLSQLYSDYHDATTIEEGKNLLSILIDKNY